MHSQRPPLSSSLPLRGSNVLFEHILIKKADDLPSVLASKPNDRNTPQHNRKTRRSLWLCCPYPLPQWLVPLLDRYNTEIRTKVSWISILCCEFEARVHRPSSVSYMCKINASAQLTVDKYTIAAYNAYPSSFCTRTHTHIISLKTQTRQDMHACNFAYIRTCHSSIYLAHIFAMSVAMRALHRGRCRRRRCRAAATSQLLHRYTI